MKTEPEINMGLSYPINFAGSNTVRKKTTAPQQCKTSLDWNLIEHGFGVRRALLGVARTLRLRAHTQLGRAGKELGNAQTRNESATNVCTFKLQHRH